MKARIFGASGIVSEGRVVRFGPEKDGEGKTEAEIHVDNEKRILRAGMSVEGLIDLEKEGEALLIPRSAVFSENNSEYVYKLSAGRAARHRVVLGSVRGDEIAVTQGISAGDAIIVDWKGIKPGTRIRASASTN
jgi:multidrug efflux pump subunit AcrA (membrane-fusion protein)